MESREDIFGKGYFSLLLLLILTFGLFVVVVVCHGRRGFIDADFGGGDCEGGCFAFCGGGIVSEDVVC